VRELGVYSEIISGDSTLGEAELQDCVGIILSGSPYSAYEERAPAPHQSLYACGLPMLGICYGIQRITLDSGGSWCSSPSVNTAERRFSRGSGSEIALFAGCQGIIQLVSLGEAY